MSELSKMCDKIKNMVLYGDRERYPCDHHVLLIIPRIDYFSPKSQSLGTARRKVHFMLQFYQETKGLEVQVEEIKCTINDMKINEMKSIEFEQEVLEKTKNKMLAFIGYTSKSRCLRLQGLY